jgi:hypothetical protein
MIGHGSAEYPQREQANRALIMLKLNYDRIRRYFIGRKTKAPIQKMDAK